MTIFIVVVTSILRWFVKIEVDESFSLRLVKYYKEAVMVSYHRSLTDSCKNINRIIVFGNVSKQFAKNGRVEKTQPSKWKIAGLFEQVVKRYMDPFGRVKNQRQNKNK